MGIAGRRRPQPGGDDLRLLPAGEQLRRGRVLPLDAVERLLDTPFAQVSPHILHSLSATAEGVGDLPIRPPRPASVSLQEYLGTPNLLAGAFDLLDDLCELIPFLGCQVNDVYLTHESLLARRPAKIAGKEDHRQSQFLGMTKH